MKGDKPSKSYIQGLKYCPTTGGPRPGATKDFPTSQPPPKAVANPPKSKVGM